MQLFTVVSLLIAVSGAAYAVIAAIKEYTNSFVASSIDIAKDNLQNTDPEKSGKKTLYLQALSNHKWGIRFAWIYRICFFVPVIVFCILVIAVIRIAYKSGPSTEIITEANWPIYKAFLFWVPIGYALSIVFGLVAMVIMICFFGSLKNKSDVGLDPGAVSKIPDSKKVVTRRRF